MYSPKSVTIIGFGRFGQTLYRLLRNDFAVTIFSNSPLTNEEKSNLGNNATIATSLADAYAFEVIFFCIPISAFENVVKEHKKYFKASHVLIDVLSVKVYPKKVFEKYLKNTHTSALLTHPMFGPDSSREGFVGLPLIIDKFKSDKDQFNFWKNYFLSKKINVIEMLPEQHDRLAANSQGITHFIGRLLEGIGIQKGPIDSLGAKKLLEIKDQTCNDSWQLFSDLQNYNPYTKTMRLKLGQVYDDLYNKLLPTRVSDDFVVFGIQGGKGSFNEEAILKYISNNGINDYKIKYLFTTKNVLKSLHNGEIDYGQFAISNSKGGLVLESIEAIPGYKFSIVAEFNILIQHFLMKRKDVDINEITEVMAHQQVFAQCKETLQKKYPKLVQKSGTGDLVDTAKAAHALEKGKLPKNTAILGPQILASHFKFDVVDKNLQDVKDNLTKFLIVKR